ncbi:hypothetical protein LZ32DRAFT_63090 [Colletotrichum eremochloae]|nr:hypothetical protein LZ32DRAFT_63090 [Colletotrichum eremochloae]
MLMGSTSYITYYTPCGHGGTECGNPPPPRAYYLNHAFLLLFAPDADLLYFDVQASVRWRVSPREANRGRTTRRATKQSQPDSSVCSGPFQGLTLAGYETARLGARSPRITTEESGHSHAGRRYHPAPHTLATPLVMPGTRSCCGHRCSHLSIRNEICAKLNRFLCIPMEKRADKTMGIFSRKQ